MYKEVIFHYGAASEPLERQANEQGFTLGDEEKLLEDLNRYILMCWLHGICTDSQHNSMLDKLQNKVMKALKTLEKEVE